MGANKTKPEAKSAAEFIASIPDEGKRNDAGTLCALLERLSGEPPVMWGSSIVGFGSYHYRYDSGREGDWARIGFSPRAKELVVYLMGGFERHAALLERLGKHKTGKSCLYLKSLAGVDMEALEALLAAELAYMRSAYPEGA